jgi:C-terminal processing protease CtpA/Prc
MRIRVSDKQPVSFEHDLPGGAFQLLSDRIAYLKLSSVQAFDIPRYLDIAKNTDGLIVDIRNYPSDFVVFALGSHLVYQLTNFARFTNGDLSNPGAFYWTGPESLTPKIPNYQGKIVILVDEVTVSQAEYTAMALRASPRAVVIGSTTAGADGNVSDVPLPGGLHTLISGIGVYYPDRRPTQQIGIQPDIIVKPTINGIRAGRDEILEAAIRHIAGSNAPICAIEKLIREREREASRDLETHSQQSSREQRSKGDPEFGTSISSEPCSVQ